jgi:hypothetical protein
MPRPDSTEPARAGLAGGSGVLSADLRCRPGAPFLNQRGGAIGMADLDPMAGYRLSRGPLEVQPIGCKSEL